jgi:host factor-I protein
MARHNINIQDGFLFQNLKEGQTMSVELITGRHFEGKLKRFDRFAVVIESDGKEILVYKHAIATLEATALSATSVGETGASA